MGAVRPRRKLDETRTGAGQYVIEGFSVRRVGSSGSVKRWLIDDPAGQRMKPTPATLGEAREMIRTWVGELAGVWILDDGRVGDLLRDGGVLRFRAAVRVLPLR